VLQPPFLSDVLNTGFVQVFETEGVGFWVGVAVVGRCVVGVDFVVVGGCFFGVVLGVLRWELSGSFEGAEGSVMAVAVLSGPGSNK
jgi:hypothetical protein